MNAPERVQVAAGRNFVIGPQHPAYALLAAYHEADDVDALRTRHRRLREAFDATREALAEVAARLGDAQLSEIVAEMEHA